MQYTGIEPKSPSSGFFTHKLAAAVKNKDRFSERGNKMEKKAAAAGAFCGILNGLFGSGGGMVAVPALQKIGLSQKEAHATSVAVMAALSAASAALYAANGRFLLSEALPFLLPGIWGGIFGALVFRQTPPILLKNLFGGLIIFAALRMLFRAVTG